MPEKYHFLPNFPTFKMCDTSLPNCLQTVCRHLLYYKEGENQWFFGMWGFFKILTIKKVLYLVCRKAANSKCGENIKYILLKVKKMVWKSSKKVRSSDILCQNKLNTRFVRTVCRHFWGNQHVVRGLIEPHPKTHLDKKEPHLDCIDRWSSPKATTMFQYMIGSYVSI